jgi:hypothetical protein
MSPRVVGPSRQVIDVDESIASGLVDGGHCEYVKEHADGETPADDQKQQEPPQGDGSGSDDQTSGSDSEEPQDEAGDRPAGNASREVWVEFALAQGKTEDDLQGLKQTEIRALFADQTE